jgi:uncharacterized protein
VAVSAQRRDARKRFSIGSLCARFELCHTTRVNLSCPECISGNVDNASSAAERAERVVGYYALVYEVVDDFARRRLPYRDDHLKLAHEAQERGELVLAGTLTEPADGALLVFRGEEPAPAENFARHDPYVIHGLVRHWHVRPWTVVVGTESLAKP